MSRINSKKYIAVIITLFIGASLLFYVFPNEKENTAPIWKSGSITPDTQCKEDCEQLSSLAPGHKGEKIQLVYNPRINDEIAQWGDCLDTVMRCKKDKNNSFRDCVSTSSCPQACKKAIKEDTRPDDIAFEALFINNGGLCVPQDTKN